MSSSGWSGNRYNIGGHMQIRCFVGLELPASYQQGLQEIISIWQHKLRSKISWTKKGNWHLTLCFLGQLSQDQIQQAMSGLQQVRMPSFELKARGGGFFPPGRQPSVIWAGVESGSSECSRLAALIRQAVYPLGQNSNQQQFKPHLTLGRVKQAKQDDWKEFLDYLLEVQWPSFQVQSFCLWSSRLQPTGAQYTLLRRYSLE